MSNPCRKSPQKACAGLFCPEDRTYLGLTVQTDGNEEVLESFCVSTWTPEQLAAFRAFVGRGASSSPVSLDELARIQNKPVRIFHLLHSLFGPEEIKRFYNKHTIRLYRQRLRDIGLDYPRRSVPTGPRQPQVIRDLGMGPSKSRRSKSANSSPVASALRRPPVSP